MQIWKLFRYFQKYFIVLSFSTLSQHMERNDKIHKHAMHIHLQLNSFFVLVDAQQLMCIRNSYYEL